MRSNQQNSKKHNIPSSVSITQQRLVFILGIIVAIFGFILYMNTIGNDYALDDVAVITKNKFVQNGFNGIPSILHTFYWQGYWDLNAGLYRPLSLILFAIEWQLFPDAPHIYHFINVLLYTFTGFLLFKTLVKSLPKLNIVFPFIVSLIFIAHPIHTEVVANIKSADELLCFLFFLLSINSLLNYLSSKSRNKLIWSLSYFFISLFAKESAASFLFIIPLLIYFFTDSTLKTNRNISLLFLLITGIFLAIHSIVLSNVGLPRVSYSYHDNSILFSNVFSKRMATTIFIMGNYLKLLFIPYPLSYDYSFNQVPITSFSNIIVIASIIIFIGMIVYAVLLFRKRDLISFSILFYLITIFLVSNLIVLIGSTMAERFLFIPSLSFCLIIGFLITKLAKKINLQNNFVSVIDFLKQNSKVLIPVLALLLIYSLTTINRNSDWKDNYSLFKHDVLSAPNSGRTHFNYGTELLNRYTLHEIDTVKKMNELDTVINELMTSIKIDPQESLPFNNLEVALEQYYNCGKNYPKVIEYSLEAMKYIPNDTTLPLILGKAYYKNKNFNDAIKFLGQAAENGCHSEELYNLIGGAYMMRYDFKHSIDAYKKAIDINPKHAINYYNLGCVYVNMNDNKNAVTLFKKTLELEPQNKLALRMISLAYKSLGDKENETLYTQMYKAVSGGAVNNPK